MASSHGGDISNESGAAHIESTSQFDALIESGQRVLVDFYADWCGPCKMVAPTVDGLAVDSEYPVVKLDIEEFENIASRYDVSSIPTFIVFDGGVPTERMLGVQDKSSLAAALEP
jgi:thioredoxin 1